MAGNTREYELILIGATGYTGKLTAEWISGHLPTDLKWAIAGRNAQKLQKVADELKIANPDRKQPDIEVCELKKDQLDVLVKRTRLIITTVGPYMYHGEPVLAACAENGTHYLDCTGEVPWYYDMVAKYDDIAKKNGAIIIPECGLDSVPADILSFALSNHIRKTLKAPTLSVIMTLHAVKAGFSGGTLDTILSLFSRYSLLHLATSMKPYSICPVKPSNPATLPKPNLFYRLLGLQDIPELSGLQTTGLMAGVDACIVHRSWGLHEKIANDTSTPDLSYGPRFRFAEYMYARGFLHGITIAGGISLGGMLFAFPPTRWILSPLLRKFVLPAPGAGPTPEERKDEFMVYRAVATADTEKQEKVLGTVHMQHGGYMTTALTLSSAAKMILRGDLAATEAGKLGGGILTPSTLGEQFVNELNAQGITIEVGVPPFK
ncbi:Saccharopine dehydrogenase [Amniculicola lignicola CBS 123094]|uniref:Saccharopine dehydrogenase n=1 Tax=Amniculicola lignicola CBS 123094 TaxID=1392246 RepID=A0A6A5WQD5_9PLEO|nr:Saccharopine dehydrogenase [Amniculicola lignicola CBS 123094]